MLEIKIVCLYHACRFITDIVTCKDQSECLPIIDNTGSLY
jgi:hypothetical protein